MKKSLIALAVAGAFAAPAFAATSNVDVYGVLNIAIQDTDVSGTDMSILDNTSRIGFKGSEDLGGGLKAIWQIESALGGNGGGAIGGTGAEGLGTRNTFVGLSGGFGTVLMGRHDTPYKLGTGSLDIFGDTIADYNLGRTDGVQLVMNTHDARATEALAYISPTWSGFHFAVAAVMNNSADVGDNFSSGKTIDAVSATAVYTNGPLFASLSYQNAEDATGADDTDMDSKGVKLGLGYTFGDAKVGFVYEDISGGAGERDSWLVNGAYNMGPIVLKAQYGQVDAGSADQAAWALGADYNLSKRTAAYVVYANGDDDSNDDVSGWNIGIKHSF